MKEENNKKVNKEELKDIKSKVEKMKHEKDNTK